MEDEKLGLQLEFLNHIPSSNVWPKKQNFFCVI